MAGPPLRKPAVQVSRKELLAARVIELGLARLLQGNRSSVIFPHHLPLHLNVRHRPPTERIHCAGSLSITLVLSAERVSTPHSKRGANH
jgi:hypothetical protein